jgi:hypothetical protein
MNTALTPEILLSHGFVELEEKDVLDRPIYRLTTIKEYPFNVEVVLSPEYPQSNPNCGVVSIQMDVYSYVCVPDDLVSKEIWTEEDQERADNNTDIMPELRQPIAWHVTTYERLRTIVLSLTQKDLEYGK